MEESGNDAWTDEKHLRYLNSMEASFVRTMIETNNYKSRLLRLDRHLPDTSDSTLDLKSQRTSKLKPRITSSSERRMDGRVEKRYKISNSSQDQVVPQLEYRRTTIGDKDENDDRTKM
ncbi:uncharacterized protein LOC133834759 [Humulus lupulus]|uniref:uncharacterized protein LOC133834759 n=1 Tax=Humulus lupulus TaxID=3486 RepID=UPI002B40A887|nr:uncharacterized protein LOC133834759 [Humulus lupulus]